MRNGGSERLNSVVAPQSWKIGMNMVAPPLGRRKLSPTRIEHRERMREEILIAARKLIGAGGVDNLTMRTLGREVGVTAATLYGYFQSKESVLEALLKEKLDTMRRMLVDSAQGLPPGAARLLGFAMGYRRFARTSPDFYTMFIFKLDPPDWDEIALGHGDQDTVLAAMHDEVRTAMDQGEMIRHDVGQVCQMLWATAHGYITLESAGCFESARLTPAEQDRVYLEHVLLAGRGLFNQERIEEILRTHDYVGGTAGEVEPGADRSEIATN
jgi:AcrR family transcriptional regulator